MTKNSPKEKLIPQIINTYKPAGCTSYDVIRFWKKKLKGKVGKIGHFGTLDPFACGVLMIGVSGAQRLNEYIHECLPKTYLAFGVLGLETETGDLTDEPSQVDESEYLMNEISKFSKEFIQEKLNEKFLGEYMQAPHKYSAAKFEGKALHEWARAGVEIKKDKKLRHVYAVEVVSYKFPKLDIRFTVSSGTYIRTLFSDCANYLGTLGVLEGLEREKVGGCVIDNAIKKDHWDNHDTPFLNIDEVLDFSSFILAEKEEKLFSNGVELKLDRVLEKEKGTLDYPYVWVRNTDKDLLGLAHLNDVSFRAKVNFN